MRKLTFRHGAAAALATLAATTVLAGVASPARADVSIAGVSLSKTAVVLDGDAGCGDRTKVTVRVWDPRPTDDEVFNVSADVVGPGGDITSFLLMNLVSRSGNYATYSDDVFLCGFDKPGNYRVKAEVTWWDASETDTRLAERSASFTVKRPASLTYNAAPEPVKKGKKLTHSGVLKLDPVGYGPKFGAKNVTLKLYFKANGAKAYAYKGSVKTGKGGKFSKKLAATKSGTWQIVYAGDAYRQKVVKTDAVKVS